LFSKPELVYHEPILLIEFLECFFGGRKRLELKYHPLAYFFLSQKIKTFEKFATFDSCTIIKNLAENIFLGKSLGREFQK